MSLLVGWDRGADRASNDADVSSILPISRVEDWRAGLGRSLCSLFARPFVCECHSISTMPRFQSPPRRTHCAAFPLVRSPV